MFRSLVQYVLCVLLLAVVTLYMPMNLWAIDVVQLPIPKNLQVSESVQSIIDDENLSLESKANQLYRNYRQFLSRQDVRQALDNINGLVILSSTQNVEDPLQHAYILANAANTHDMMDKPQRAEDYYVLALDLMEEEQPLGNDNVIQCFMMFAKFLDDKGEKGRALKYLEKAEKFANVQQGMVLKIYKAKLEPNFSNVGQSPQKHKDNLAQNVNKIEPLPILKDLQISKSVQSLINDEKVSPETKFQLLAMGYRQSMANANMSMALDNMNGVVILSSTENVNDPIQHAYALANAANAYDKAVQFDLAESFYSLAFDLFEKENALEDEATMRWLLAYTKFLSKRGDNEQALEYLAKAEKIGSPSLNMHIDNYKKEIAKNVQREKSTSVLATQIAEQNTCYGDKDLPYPILFEINSLMEASTTSASQNNYAEAQTYASKMIDVYKNSELEPNLGLSKRLLLLVGEIYPAYTDINKKLKMIDDAMDISQTCAAPATIAFALKSRGDANFQFDKEQSKKDFEELLNFAEEAPQNSIPHKDIFLSDVANQLGAIYLENLEHKNSDKYFRKAIEYLKGIEGQEVRVANLHSQIGNTYLSLQKFHEAGKEYQEAHRILSSGDYAASGGGRFVSTINFNLYTYYNIVGKDELAKKHLNQVIFDCEDGIACSSYAYFLAKKHMLRLDYQETNDLDNYVGGTRELQDSVASSLGEDNPFYASIEFALIDTYIKSGQYNIGREIVNKYISANLTRFEDIRNYSNYNLLGIINFKEGRVTDSIDYFLKSFDLKDKQREVAFSFLSEREKYNYLGCYRDSIFSLITAANGLGDNRKLIEEIYQRWITYKGVILADRKMSQLAINGHDSELKSLQSLRKEIFQAYMFDRSNVKFLDEKIEEKERLEKALYANNESYKETFKKANARELMAEVSDEDVIIDFAKYIDDISNLETDKIVEKYSAFIIKNNSIELIHLGNAEQIDKLISDYRKLLNKHITYIEKTGKHSKNIVGKLNSITKHLYEKTYAKISNHFSGKKRLIVSPDGEMSLIPLEIFESSDGKYFIEEFEIYYLTNAKHYSPNKDFFSFGNMKTAVLFGDPDFDSNRTYEVPQKNTSLPSFRGVKKELLADLRFSRLPETRDEIDLIKEGLSREKGLKVKTVLGQDANESNFLSTVDANILHVASHGYFLSPQNNMAVNNPLENQQDDSLYNTPSRQQYISPMLQSGLVLAGVNSSLAVGQDNGLVSAEKLLGMDLSETKLLVLSACNTGSGDALPGEGVYGLERSLLVSGAENLVLSLWPVPSDETKELMVNFYKYLVSEESVSNALRKAKISMLNKYDDPFYWGAFVHVSN
ncbi:CHAT domain-containing protein [Thermodesulfobacteriota bacterium]